MTMNSQRRSLSSCTAEGGFALIGVLLLMILMSAAAVVFLNATGSELKIGGGDREDSLAYYGAEAAMEKMMVDVGLVYTAHKVPKNTDFGAVPGTCPITGVACVLPDATLYPQPTVPGITYPTYAISFPNGVDPVSHLLTPGATDTVQSGDFAGLSAQTIPLTLTVVSQRPGGAQVSMVRNVQVALIPVFQFGVFSETDLSYFPGPNFDFAGRVHTNGSLYLAASATLAFHDHITVVNQVVHSKLANGVDITGTRKGPVLIPSTTAAGCNFAPPAVVPSATTGCRNLSLNAGGQVEESANTNWLAISTSVDPTGFNGFLKGASAAVDAQGNPLVPGAHALKLPFVADGVGPIEIIRRAASTDTSQDVINSRLYNQAQIRVLLDDGNPVTGKCLSPLLKSTDDFQTVMLTNGIAVSGTTIAATGVTTDDGAGASIATQFGVADSSQDPNFLNNGRQGANLFPDPVSPGCLRVEYRNAAGNYIGVTQEWLHLGFARSKNAAGFTTPNTVNPNAILILQRDSNMAKTTPNKWYPINLYDAREGERDPGTGTGLALGGVMNLVEIDVGNLKKWLDGNSPSDISSAARSGSLVEKTSQNGYVLYFSDRRGMLKNPDTWSANCAAHPDPLKPFVHTPPDADLSGDYGYEDVVKPGGTLDTGEDSNENCHLDTYGAANLGAGFGSTSTDPYSLVPITQLATPSYTPTAALNAGARSVSGARHALRLVNGGLGNVPSVSPGVGGFTVASENPVYILGNYNATSVGCTSNGCWLDPTSVHSHAAVIADAVTLLSNAWNDDNSLQNPTTLTGRIPTDTYFRVAIAGGKSLTFPHFSAEEDYGTDGGVHNFLRFLENWGGVTVHYRGSLVSFYYSHQATGTFKADGQVYSPPARDFSFDLDFKDPTKMPPGTPRFQDVVNIGYQQDFTPQ